MSVHIFCIIFGSCFLDVLHIHMANYKPNVAESSRKFRFQLFLTQKVLLKLEIVFSVRVKLNVIADNNLKSLKLSDD